MKEVGAVQSSKWKGSQTSCQSCC